MPDTLPRTAAERLTMLLDAIRRSGLSRTQFAKRVLGYDPRSLRRLLHGERTITDRVLERATRQAGDGHPMPTGSDDTSSPASPADGERVV